MNKLLVNNFLYNLIYQCVSLLTPLITAPYISRVLGAEGVGINSYTFTIVQAFTLFATLGTAGYGQREIARHRDSQLEYSVVFWELSTIRTVMTVLTGMVFVGLCFAYREYTVYLLQQSFFLWLVFLDCSWFFQGIEDFKIVALRNCLVKISSVALVFLLVKNQTHIGRFILINSLSSVISVLLFLPMLREKIVFVNYNALHIKRHFRGVIEFFIPLIATQIYSQLDKLMLGAMSPDIVQSGYYEQARKLVNILVALMTTINTVMFPRITNLYAKNDREQILNMYNTTFRLILMFLPPVMVGLWIISDNFVLWFYGPDFTPVSLLLKFSGILIAFISVGNFVGMQYLSPTGRQNQMTFVYLIAAAINVFLNMCLIPRFLALGAVIASVLAEAFSCFAQIYLIKTGEYNFALTNGLCKYSVGAGIMGVTLLVFHLLINCIGPLATLIDVTVGAAVYFMVLFLLREEFTWQTINRIYEKVYVKH